VFIALGLNFRKVDPGVFCTTMHWRILWAFSMSFWRNEGSPCYPSHPTPPIYHQLTFLFPKLKIGMKRNKIQGCFIYLTDCDERTEGDTGRSIFLGHSIHCISDVNVVWKPAGTILSDGINKYFYLFFVWFLWPQFGNLIVTLCTFWAMDEVLHNCDNDSTSSQTLRASLPLCLGIWIQFLIRSLAILS
jgi:hypothetical protein